MPGRAAMNAAEYLSRLVREREEVERFLAKDVREDMIENNKGWTHDPELGWVLKDSSS